MRARWLRTVWAGLILLALGGTCGPVQSEPGVQTPPSRITPVAAEPAPTLTPTLAATAAVPTETPAPPRISPTPSPDPTPTPPSPTPEPTTAVHLYIPTAGVDDAAPTAAATGEPSVADQTAERLRRFVQEGIREEFPDADPQPVHVFPLVLAGASGDFWVAVTDGPQPARITADDEVVNFWHFAAVYRLSAEDHWIEVDRLEVELAPQRTQVDLAPTGWALADGAPAAWITVRGGTGAHAGTLNIIRFDGATLSTELSWLSARPYAGEVTDLDGDGLVEVVVNDSDPYVFCYACAVELKREILYWWDGSRLVPVDLRAPVANVPAGVADEVDEFVALARAGLWRDAALAAIAAARQAPESAEVRWLSVLVNRTAAARLLHAGSVAQPLLTTVFAGEYGAAVDLMRALDPAQGFALDGPLIIDTEAEHDLTTMATQMLDHTTRALDAVPDRAEIHAVHALSLTLASPDDLSRARSAIQRAVELAPDDPFFAAASDFLVGVPQAPGTPPSPPDGPEPVLPGPSDEFFAGGNLLGSGDRGRNVKALHQRLACLRVPGFNDPGRYFDEYHEATRRAVVQFQADHGLTPTGVVGAVTWQTIEDASVASPDCNVQALALPSNARFVLARDALVDDAPADNQPADDEPVNDRPADIAGRPSYGEAGQPVVYLTFDDGPHASYTVPMLEILARYDAVATFFVLGVQVQRFPEVLEQVVAGGHRIASHTVNHPSLANLTREEFIGEVAGGDEAIRAVVGDRADPLGCLRPPYGAVDERTAPLAGELGKALVMWDVDPQDWRQPGAEQIASYVLSHATPGAIILMHDGGGGRSQTVAALETVLAELSSRGYEFRGIPGCGGESASPDATPTPGDAAPDGADATVTPSG
ncbi:MAG: polysaccharide deacetylase family protein [Chloroflexi bacterium]|nr:polysaccharide deacetylase family protein [Chloroflexota bacterium]